MLTVRRDTIDKNYVNGENLEHIWETIQNDVNPKFDFTNLSTIDIIGIVFFGIGASFFDAQ